MLVHNCVFGFDMSPSKSERDMRGAPEVLFRRLELMSQLLSSILTSMELSAIATLMGLLEDVQLKRLSL